eukprot:1921989-Rhodomonas_salina.1
MTQRRSKHGKVMRGDAAASACVAEGEGVKLPGVGEVSTLVVRTIDNKGRECSEGGQAVVVQALAGGVPVEFAADKLILTRISAKDRDDGRYDVEYVVEGTCELRLVLE